MNITNLIYGVYILGIFLFQYSSILNWGNFAKHRIRLKRSFKEKKEIAMPQKGMRKHIYILIKATMNTNSEKMVDVFFLFTGFITIVSFYLIYRKISLSIGILASGIFGAIPYIILRIRLQLIRVNSSKEGDILVGELLNNYKICYYNMKEAIEKTAITIENAPNSRRLLFDLSKGLNKTGSKEEIGELLNVMRYSIDTSWGNVLTSNIYFAEVLGIKVTSSLVDLMETITRSRQVMEHEKRENNEANLMLKYLAPICFLLTIIGACKFFGFTLKKFMIYQFTTTTGITWFLIVLIFYVIGIIINIFLTKTKMDL